MIELYANNAQTTLAGAINNVATTLQLQSGAGALFPNPSTGQFFRISLSDAATQLNHEIVYCTARSGDVCTVQRAQEGTTGQNWIAGDIAANLPTAGAMGNFVQQTQLQNGSYIYAADTGSANVYQVAYTPAVTALTDGMVLRFKAAHANSGASTFSPNGLTASPIWNMSHVALSGGEIVLNGDVWLQWNSSLNSGSGAWLMIASSGGNSRAGRLLNVQVISANGTYTPTLGMASAIVEAIGGGGGGGGIPSTTAGNQAASGGGASGSYAKGWFPAATIGASVACTIGVAGTAGAAGNNAGGNGGTTSFGAILSAPGGTGGQSVASTAQGTIAYINGGSPGSVATGGTIVNSQGQPGGFGLLSSGFIRAGDGAPSVFGGGGRAAAATSPGAGGSGNAAGSSGASSAAGFAGAAGLIIVYEYA
jgi:hypothetical protein